MVLKPPDNKNLPNTVALPETLDTSRPRGQSNMGNELIIVPYVVFIVIVVRGQYKKHSVFGVFILNTPCHRRQVKSFISSIQNEFLPIDTIVSNNRDRTIYRNQE